MSGEYEFVKTVAGEMAPGEPIDTVDKLTSAYDYVEHWRTFRDGSPMHDMAEFLSSMIGRAPGIESLRKLSTARIDRQKLEAWQEKLAERLRTTPDNIQGMALEDFAAKVRDMQLGAPAGGATPLTDQQQAVLEYIKKNRPVMGTKICRDLQISSESTLTKHIIPALKPHGVKNKRGAGYYID